MSKFITVVPAYGRDFKTQKEVKAAFEAGKDFMIVDVFHAQNGSYENKGDAPKGATLNVRYAKQTKVLPIKIK